MVAVPFGFSIGDFVTGTKLLIDVLGAFKESSGASSKYASDAAFLLSLTSTLQHLDEYVKPSPQTALSSSISSLLDTVRGPLDDFKAFLDKYEASLGKASTKSRLGKVPKTVTYTLKDISGKIQKLRQQVEQPLQAVNSLLSLQQIKSIEELPDQLLRPEQCAQIVEAIKAADILTEMDKQIQVLQRSASEHNIKQDEQLQRVKDMRAKLDGGLTSLALSLEKVKGTTMNDVATKSGQQAQLDASKDLQSSISQLSIALDTGTKDIKEFTKVQKDLVFVIETFLEEKVAIQEHTIAEAKAEASSDLSNKKVESSPWPSATLPAAHMAITLLSTVVSSVTAVSVVKQGRKAREPTSIVPSRDRRTPRTISPIKQSQSTRNPTPMSPSTFPDIPKSGRSVTSYGTTLKNEIPTEDPLQFRAKAWVSDFATKYTSTPKPSTLKRSTPKPSTPSVPTPKRSTPKPSTPNVPTPKRSTTQFTRNNPLSTHDSLRTHDSPTGWNKRMSKLDDDDSNRGRRNNHENPDRHPDSNYCDTPGPVVPPPNKYEEDHNHPFEGYPAGNSGQYIGGYIEGDSGSGGGLGGFLGGLIGRDPRGDSTSSEFSVGYIAGDFGSSRDSGGYSGGYLTGDSGSGSNPGGYSEGQNASGGIWVCRNCYSSNSDLTPDFCPVCSSTR